MPQLVEALIQGRLLVAEHTGGRATITLAHEVLLEAWPGLCEWLDRHGAQMQRLHRGLSGLQAPDAPERRRAVETLSEIGPVEPEVVPALVNALNDTAEEVHTIAFKALEKIGPPAADAMLELPPQSLKHLKNAALCWLTLDKKVGESLLRKLLMQEKKIFCVILRELLKAL